MNSDILNREIVRLFIVITIFFAGDFIDNIVGLRTSIFARKFVSACCYIWKKIMSCPLISPDIPDAVLKKLKKYTENPQFDPNVVAKVSVAAKSLCMWANAIQVYLPMI